MDSITSASLKHKPEVIKNSLKKVSNTIVATTDLKIYFPERYINQSLVFMGSTVSLLGYFAIVNNKGEYGVMNIPAIFSITPNNTSEIEIDGNVNIVLEFTEGDVVVSSTSIVKNSDFYYNVFDEFFIKGKIPWFISYDSLSDLFLESKKYSNTGIGKNPLPFELLASITNRDDKNRVKFYRHVIKDNKNLLPRYTVGLNNIYYSFDNTASKLFGGYYGQGVTAAIVNKETKTTAVADILRA